MHALEHLRAPLLSSLALTLALGCGGGDESPAAPSEQPATEAAEPTTAVTETPAPTPAPSAASGPFSLANGVVFRWSDGDWIARVTATVTAGDSAVDVSDGTFTAGDAFTGWSGGASFPHTAELAAGETATGDISFYSDGEEAAPSEITITHGGNAQTIALVQVPAPPPHAVPVSNVTGELTVTIGDAGQTWRHPGDNDHIVRIPVTINNGSNVPVTLPPSFFHARYDTWSGIAWGRAATITAETVVAPGATQEGFVAWYFSSSADVPTTIQLKVGSDHQVLAQSDVSITETAAPAE